MTDSEMARSVQPTTYYQPQYQPVTPTVRGMPTGPTGSRGALEAGSLLNLGALATAAGMTQAQVQGLLDEAQEAALKAVLASAPKLLRHNREVTQARINEVAARVNQLRRVHLAQPQTGVRGFLGMPPDRQVLADAPAYVSLVEVQMILNETIAALIVKE